MGSPARWTAAASAGGVTVGGRGEGGEETSDAAARVKAQWFRVSGEGIQLAIYIHLSPHCTLLPPHKLFTAKSLTESVSYNKLPHREFIWDRSRKTKIHYLIGFVEMDVMAKSAFRFDDRNISKSMKYAEICSKLHKIKIYYVPKIVKIIVEGVYCELQFL